LFLWLQEIELNEQQTLELLTRAPSVPQLSPLTYRDLQSDETARLLPTVRSVAVTARAPAEAAVDSSLAVEAQSELDISLGALHTTHPSAGHRTAAAIKADGSTQDSPHTLDRLHAHLQQQEYNSSLGPSLESLHAQETLRTVETDQLSPQQLHERQRAYLSALPKVPRNPEAERNIYAYMKEMDRYVPLPMRSVTVMSNHSACCHACCDYCCVCFYSSHHSYSHVLY
jgi:hypothetical protein